MSPVDELLGQEPLDGLVERLQKMPDREEQKDYLIKPSNGVIVALANLSLMKEGQRAYDGLLEKITDTVFGVKTALNSLISKEVKRIIQQPLRDAGIDPVNLDTRKDGTLMCNHRNVQHLLRLSEQFDGLFAWDTFSQRRYFTKYPSWKYNKVITNKVLHYLPMEGNEGFHSCVILNEMGMSEVKQGIVEECLDVVAREQTFDYLIEYNEAQPDWDGVERNESFPERYFNIDRLGLGLQQRQLLGTMWSRFLIGQQARCYRPGCEMKYVLHMEGEQHIGKSGLVRLLGGPWAVEYSGKHIDLSDPDTFYKLTNAWVVELGEMSAVRGSEIETVKNFISQQVDVFRPKFYKGLWEVPRRFVLITTMNPSEPYLRDTTGNVRVWPMPFGNKRAEVMPFEAIKAELPQCFAEARTKYKRGDTWHLSIDEQEVHSKLVAGREIESEYLEVIQACLEDVVSPDQGISTPDIIAAITTQYRMRPPSTQHVAQVLKSLGFERMVVTKSKEERGNSPTPQKKMWYRKE